MSSMPPSHEPVSDSAGRTPPPWWYMPPTWWTQPPKKTLGQRLLRSLGIMIFILSIVFNVYLLAFVSVAGGSSFGQEVIRRGDENQLVAVYTISGIINEGSADSFAEFTREIVDAPAYKAVVLRVDSPGGGVSASDQIHAMVKRLKDKGKTVVVSMGGTAASGGYYVSAPAEYIYAEPTTITGSIGVLANWVVLRGTMDKIGAEPVVLRSTDAAAWKDEISPFRHMSDQQREHMKGVLDKMQQRFNQVVKEGRGQRLKTRQSEVTMTYSKAPTTQPAEKFTQTEPLNGKIYLADEAKDFGLIDDVGYATDAIAKAIALAKLEQPKVVEFAKRGWLFDAFFRGQAPAAPADIKSQIEDLQMPRIQMLWKVE